MISRLSCFGHVKLVTGKALACFLLVLRNYGYAGLWHGMNSGVSWVYLFNWGQR